MNLLLYFTAAMIWGSTWYAIKLQLGQVPPLWSLTYRFGLASLLLLGICLVTKRPLRFNLKAHGMMMACGALLFCGNYVFCYLGSEYLISGVLATLFAGVLLLNILHSHLIFKTPLYFHVILGGLLGLCGLVLVTNSEYSPTLQGYHQLWLGIIYTVIACILASWGNMTALYVKKYNLPVLESTTFSMLYGALFLLLFAILSGEKPAFDWHISYIGSLLYLAVFGSALAFMAYISLIRRIGAESASYILVLTPILALLVSTFFESMHWYLSTIMGGLLIVIGNVLVLKKQNKN